MIFTGRGLYTLQAAITLMPSHIARPVQTRVVMMRSRVDGKHSMCCDRALQESPDEHGIKGTIPAIRGGTVLKGTAGLRLQSASQIPLCGCAYFLMQAYYGHCGVWPS